MIDNNLALDLDTFYTEHRRCGDLHTGGLAYCASCNGALISQARFVKRQAVKVYGCSYHSKRGSKVCANGVQVPQRDSNPCFSLERANTLPLLPGTSVAVAILRCRRGRDQDPVEQIRWFKSGARFELWKRPLMFEFLVFY